MVRIFAALAPFASLLIAGHAAAQNTSGVSGPDVRAGERELGYRAAYRIDDGADGFAHRVHYQQSLDERWRLRLIVLQSEEGGDLTFSSAQMEVLMQFVESEKSGGWDSALRIDGTIPLEDGKPGRARIGWLNSFDIHQLQVRADVFVAREVGQLASDRVILEARAEATYPLSSSFRIGVQTFNVARSDDAAEVRRQLGFVAKSKLTNRLRMDTGALFGLSPDSPDADLRMFFSYAL